MSKEIDIICETMHKSGVPLSEDQRAILAGCLAVLCDKQKIRTATLDEVKEAVELNRMGTNKDDHESDRYYDKAIDASIKAIDNLRGAE